MKKVYLHKNLQIIFSITLMSIAGVSAVAPVLPKISEALRVPRQEIGLLITVFTLPGVIFPPVLGALSDRWGRKKVLVPSLILFGIAGTACGFAKTFEVLMVLRFIQGVGAAALGILNLTMIGDIYSGEERAEALGYNAGVLSLGTAIYPAIGGLLALFGWNYPFMISIFSIPVAALVWFELDHMDPGSENHVDHYIRSVLGILKNRTVLGLLCATISSFVVIYGLSLTAYPLLMRRVFSASPALIGSFLAMMSIGTAGAAFGLKYISRKFSFRTLIPFGFFLYAFLAVVFPFCGNLWFLILPTIAFGFASGLNIPSIQTVLSESVESQYRGFLLALNGTLLRVGQTLGPLLIGIAFTLKDIQHAFYVVGGFALFMSGLVWVLLGKKNR